MKRILAITLSACMAAINASADRLWDEFVTPPDDCRTKLWWFHGETETTKEGIDADLKAFKEKGVGGVVFYDQIHGNAAGAAESMSDEWWESLKYAAMKARETGLSFEVAASNGYVAGGPWITPELSMKKTVFIDTLVTVTHAGPVTIDMPYRGKHFKDIATVMFPDNEEYRPLAFPGGKLTVTSNDTTVCLTPDKVTEVNGISYTITPRGKGSTGSMNIPGKPQERYFGAKYMEYPPVGQLEYSTDGRTWLAAADLLPVENNIGHKARGRSISFPAVSGKYFRLRFHDWSGGAPDYRQFTISDISLHRRDITDNLEVKTGLRTEVTYPSVQGGDKGAIASSSVRDISDRINADGTLSLHLDKGTWRIIRLGYTPTGAKTKHGRKNLLGFETDVMSAKAANVHYDNYFKVILDTLRRAGCGPQGMCMDSHEAGTQNWTEGFEQTFSRLNGYSLHPWIPAFAGYIVDSRQKTESMLLDFRRAVSHTIAENFYGTFARRCKSDSVEYTSQGMLNILADNITGRGKASKPQGEFWAYQTNGNYDCLDAASAAHLYGRNIASGEAFTDTPYDETWDRLLRIANIAYCRGINEFAVCASSYQPWDDRKYDDSASSHPYVFHRHHPQWESTRRFWDYQARCAAMLRKGSPVVDLCVYIGDDAPLKTFSYKLPEIPEGYNFDVCTSDALLNRMSTADGLINVTGGMSYKAIIVQDRTHISPQAESKLRKLSAQGATVIWCNKGETTEDALAKAAIAPDILIASDNLPDSKVLFFHRTTPDEDIYFVYNHSDSAYSKESRVRARFKTLEYWRPATLERETIATDDNGTFSLNLSPYESTFIIARRH
jgi:hypothetical protein